MVHWQTQEVLLSQVSFKPKLNVRIHFERECSFTEKGGVRSITFERQALLALETDQG